MFRSDRIAAVLSVVFVLSLLAAPAVAHDHKGDEYGKNQAKADIVDTAIAAGSFETLVAAVKAAGLVEALKGEGPFTVFAPTDEAFAALPEGTVETLLKPENKEKLVAILTYHVLPTKAKSDVAVTLDHAEVVKADVMASNGVIHVIDKVIMPKDTTSSR